MIFSCSIAYTVNRPMLSRRAISGTVMRPLGAPEWQLMSGVAMELFFGNKHPGAEWAMGFYSTGFAGPFVLTSGSIGDGSEAIFGYG
jgi:hypothetical protein